MDRKAWTSVVTIIIVIAALPAAGRGAVLLATPSDYQSRIKDLKPGDTLELAAGTYTQGLSITGQAQALHGRPRRHRSGL